MSPPEKDHIGLTPEQMFCREEIRVTDAHDARNAVAQPTVRRIMHGPLDGCVAMHDDALGQREQCYQPSRRERIVARANECDFHRPSPSYGIPGSLKPET